MTKATTAPTAIKNGLCIVASESAAVVYIHGGINLPDDDGYYVDPKAFVEEVKDIKSSSIDVRLATVGGDPIAAGAMYQSLVDHPAKVRTIVDSTAYSAGSMILQAGDTRVARPLAMVMVHGPGTFGVKGRGTAADHREMAAALDAHAEMMVPAYTRHGVPEATVRGWLESREDKYFSASDALAAGLIDEIEADAAAISSSAPEDYRIAAMSGGDPLTTTTTPDSSTKEPSTQEIAEMAENEDLGAAPVERATTTTPGPDTIVTQHSKTVEAAQRAGQQREAKRRQTITAVFDGFYTGDPLDVMTALHDQCLADINCTELDARAKIMAVLRSTAGSPVVASQSPHIDTGSVPPGASAHLGGLPPRIAAGPDALDKITDGITAALMTKAGYTKDDKERRAAEGSGFMAMSLLEMGDAYIRAQGIPSRMSADAMGRAAHILARHTASDFPEVLGNIAHKAAMIGYNEAPETWMQWCKVGNLTDFKQAKRVTTTAFPELDLIPESGEYKHATISDVGEPIQLGTFGKKFAVSRQMLINDDINAFTDIPRKMGRAAARTPGNLAYAVLTANAALNQDSVELFHADHNNLGTAGVPSKTTLQEAFLLMALQQDPDANVVALNLEPQFLIVPRTLRSTARVLIGSEKDPTYSADNPGTPVNEFYNALTVVSDARLDAASTTAWYAVANKNQADTVEVAFLNGNQMPVVEQIDSMSPDGRDFYVRLDCAAAALGYVGMVKNAGA